MHIKIHIKIKYTKIPAFCQCFTVLKNDKNAFKIQFRLFSDINDTCNKSTEFKADINTK